LPAGLRLLHSCGSAAPLAVRCFSTIVVGRRVSPSVTPSPDGPYGPADLRAAYRVPADLKGNGQTVALVDAYDDPTAGADLQAYRGRFGLPPCAAGCFTKVDQRGGHHYPVPDTGWAQEESADLDMVSAMCPNCHILLVEADSPTMTDMGAAVDTAVRLGAVAVSNSYGGVEDPSEASLDVHFDHPGVAITAATGDTGYGAQYPAASPYVTAVGGTTLTRNASARGFGETAWSGGGSGCSAYEPKPGWQHDGGCSHRTVSDVAAVADPATGVFVYDSYAPSPGDPAGWLEVGGTSVAAPIVASLFALGPAGRRHPSSIYAGRAGLNDVVSGSNNPTLIDELNNTLSYVGNGGVDPTAAPLVRNVLNPCPGNYLCNARPGYDGPTGWGTPSGIAAF
jgi:subtilase family serine protease